MTQDNVDIVRKSLGHVAQRDLAGLLRYYDPEVVWDLTHFREWPDNTYHGHEGLLRFLTSGSRSATTSRRASNEVIAAPDGRVASLAWQRGTGRQSGLAMDMKWALIATLRGGKVVRVEHYDDQSKVLEAAGLRG